MIAEFTYRFRAPGKGDEMGMVFIFGMQLTLVETSGHFTQVNLGNGSLESLFCFKKILLWISGVAFYNEISCYLQMYHSIIKSMLRTDIFEYIFVLLFLLVSVYILSF